jgi:hypothetical protein
MKRTPSNANHNSLPGEYAQLPPKVARALQACPEFCSNLLGPITEYLTAGLSDTKGQDEPDVDKQWEDFVRFNLLLEHLKDAIEIIDATQRKRLFSKLGNWQPILAQEQETKAPKTERKEQLRLDVEQMINRAVDRANKRANGQR